MKVPNREMAVVPTRKVVDYPLNPSHPSGSPKAIHFMNCGFKREEWRVLAELLYDHVQRHEIRTIDESPHGAGYTVEGEMNVPEKESQWIRSMWIVK